LKPEEGAILAGTHATTLEEVHAIGDMSLDWLSRVASSICRGALVISAINQVLTAVEAA
jgi:hypothetical protein